MSETIPNFVVAGASKAGTEWLRVALREHPDIWMPPGLDTLDFFSRRYDRGAAWYRSAFAGHKDERAVGEKSSSYIIIEEAAERLAQWNPDLKIVLVLRQPIDRAYSHYCMWLRGGLVTGDVDAELSVDSPLVSEGFYYRHIERFRKYFPQHQMKIMLYDDLRADAGMFLANIYSFLGVDDTFRPSVMEERYHATKGRPRAQWLYNSAVKVMKSVSRSSSAGHRFVEFLRRKGYVNIVHKLNEGEGFPQLSTAARRRLAELYRDDVDALSQMIDRDLSHWLAKDLATVEQSSPAK